MEGRVNYVGPQILGNLLLMTQMDTEGGSVTFSAVNAYTLFLFPQGLAYMC